MPLLPLLHSLFEARQARPAPPAERPAAEMRASTHAMMEQSYYVFRDAQARVTLEWDVTIPVESGEIVLRIYRNGADQAVLPCHVYYHGGGFFAGTLEHSDDPCRALAREVGCVVSVDYRLAPEYRFPTAAEDAYAALRWVASQAAELLVDSARISVGGVSAGGNLAAVVAQLARDRGGPAIIAQVLEIPVTDFTSTRTLDFPGEDILIGAEKSYAPVYLRDEADAHDPLASPLLAPSLARLPPALVMCAEYDQLQPEGEAYAERLADEGVATVYQLWTGQFHGSQEFDQLIPKETAAYRAAIAAFLRTAYASVSR